MTVHKFVFWVVLLLAAAWAPCGCQSGGERQAQGPPLELSLALVPYSYSGLIAIADAKGFFQQVGLKVSTQEYPSGLAAVEALGRGEVQMATAADVVMALKSQIDPSLRVVASIGSSSANEIVARKDCSILCPADLRGKRVGFSPNTTSEYFLFTFLLTHAIRMSEIIPVSLPPAQLVDAVVKGDVDAISSWDINVYHAKQRLGVNGIAWPAQNHREWYWLVIVREELTWSPEPIKRFLEALLKAERFLLAHEDEAKDVIMRQWGLEADFLRQVWGRTQFNVSLKQSLVISVEDYVKWTMTKAHRSGDLPNVLNCIYTDALDEVEPKAITIFR